MLSVQTRLETARTATPYTPNDTHTKKKKGKKKNHLHNSKKKELFFFFAL